MENKDSSVHVYDTHVEAEEAIRSLAKSGFDLKKLSLVGKGYHSEEHPVGFYTAGDRVKSWGGVGAFWGGIWGLMFAPAVFFGCAPVRNAPLARAWSPAPSPFALALSHVSPLNTIKSLR